MSTKAEVQGDLILQECVFMSEGSLYANPSALFGGMMSFLIGVPALMLSLNIYHLSIPFLTVEHHQSPPVLL